MRNTVYVKIKELDLYKSKISYFVEKILNNKQIRISILKDFSICIKIYELIKQIYKGDKSLLSQFHIGHLMEVWKKHFSLKKQCFLLRKQDL